MTLIEFSLSSERTEHFFGLPAQTQESHRNPTQGHGRNRLRAALAGDGHSYRWFWQPLGE